MKKKKSGQNTPSVLKTRNGVIILITLISLVLYGNTLFHDFALDDAIVITDNEYTQKGISGIPDILSKDTFAGFFKEEGKSNLVAGGRYRPMSLVGFAIGHQIWGANPMLFHLFNLIFFGILSYCLYLLLSSFKRTRDLFNGYFPLLVVVLFMFHPIHTEVVANIKGRDEIYALLGSLLACWILLKNKQATLQSNIIAGIVFFLALMSKENAITFLAIAPLSFVLLNESAWSTAIKKTSPLWLATIIFLIIRTSILGMDFGDSPRELMNNPFLKIKGGQYVDFSMGEKLGTIFYTLGDYLKLLVFPHPLTHDYYPKHIDVIGFGNARSILALIVYLGLGIFSVLRMKKKPILSFSILFYLLSLSIVSNIVFPVGTNMAERFMFMPSVGFAMASGLLIYYLFQKNKTLAFAVLGILLLGYTFKTIHRNQVWKDDFTLFTSDVKISKNSAKCLNAAGGVIQTKAHSMTDGPKKTALLNEGIGYLNRAINIHPNYKNAYLLLGNSQFYLRKYGEAIKTYEKALQISPGYTDAENNLAVAYRELGKEMGEKQNNLSSAINYLTKSYNMRPNDAETVRLLGVAYGISNDHQKAVSYFEKLTQLSPQSAGAFVSLYKAYNNAGMTDKATNAYQRAIQIDPQAFNK